MIVQLGAVASRLLGLRWCSGSGCGTEQLYLVAIGIEPRLDFAPGIGDVGTNTLQFVAQPIEFGIAQTRARQFAIHAVQCMLPSACGGFEIEVELAVQALRDLRLVDMRIGRCGLAAWRGVCRRCRLRHGCVGPAVCAHAYWNPALQAAARPSTKRTFNVRAMRCNRSTPRPPL